MSGCLGTVDTLRAAFEEAVDDYLETCARLNRPPQKPYSGNLMLRIPASVHAAVATAAAVDGKSINQWAAETFEAAVKQKMGGEGRIGRQ